MTSTPGHLANWAIFLNRLPGEDNPLAEKPAALLEQVLHASPINATARLAWAQFNRPDTAPQMFLLRKLGLSRDAVCLAWMPANC